MFYRPSFPPFPPFPSVPGPVGIPAPPIIGPDHFPSQPPPGQHGPGDGHNQPPSGPPPNIQLSQSASLKAVDPGAIKGCRYRYTYIWLRNGQSFWFYPTYVGRQSISGYRWVGYMWIYYGVSLKQISSFQCV
ncbi:hypothetical protein [Falsibacillus albus]|uniref:Transporter n=1 Tax=Falsibacillus albus TaxID=2478915 RepID=A0A3L7KA02_9BACI|nr:hypothetical protein [Falsibacillus albus]RLQ97482.1 hypothetical protein D9X91_04845 [Falsibacillus albus]